MNDNIFVKKINHAWITQFLQVTQMKLLTPKTRVKGTCCHCAEDIGNIELVFSWEWNRLISVNEMEINIKSMQHIR